MVRQYKMISERCSRTFAKKTHEHVCTKGAFVGFIQDEYTIPVQISFIQTLSKENTIGHD